MVSQNLIVAVLLIPSQTVSVPLPGRDTQTRNMCPLQCVAHQQTRCFSGNGKVNHKYQSDSTDKDVGHAGNKVAIHFNIYVREEHSVQPGRCSRPPPDELQWITAIIISHWVVTAVIMLVVYVSRTFVAYRCSFRCIHS